MLKRLMWRLRYTIYGQRKTRWGWLLWWEWSGANVDEWDDASDGLNEPHDSADEDIFAAMT